MSTVLFVCTGNTCRSPMAACLFNALCQRDGRNDLCALSAGVAAGCGLPASNGARRAMERRGLSLADHRSQPVSGELLKRAGLTVVMSARHLDMLTVSFPQSATPIRIFEPSIPDPFGGDDNDYEQTARALEPQVAAIYQLLAAGTV